MIWESSLIVKLCGPTDDVDKSTKHLTKMSRDLLKSNFQVKIPIFKNIIGKGGVNIKKIRDETTLGSIYPRALLPVIPLL